jgi:hypothetical protein
MANLSLFPYPSIHRLSTVLPVFAPLNSFRMISPLQSGAMREEESHHAHRAPLDIIRNSTAIGPQSFIQFSNQPDLLFYRSNGKSQN